MHPILPGKLSLPELYLSSDGEEWKSLKSFATKELLLVPRNVISAATVNLLISPWCVGRRTKKKLRHILEANHSLLCELWDIVFCYICHDYFFCSLYIPPLPSFDSRSPLSMDFSFSHLQKRSVGPISFSIHGAESWSRIASPSSDEPLKCRFQVFPYATTESNQLTFTARLPCPLLLESVVISGDYPSLVRTRFQTRHVLSMG